MSLRVKLALALAVLAAAATVAIGVWSYVGTTDRLRSEVDRSLDDAARGIVERSRREGLVLAPPRRGPDEGSLDYRPASFEQILVQVIDGGGAVVVAPEGLELPVADVDVAVTSARDPSPWVRRDVSIDDEPYRMLTVPLGGGQGAVQLARSLAETDRLLDSLRNRTVVAVILVIAAAAALGWLVATQVTRRLVRLTSAAEEVAASGRLDVPVPEGGTDEVGRLGAAFDEMLAALARSRDAQQRLVQDAGHELRTPLTSLRTNVAVLRRYDALPPAERARLLADLDGETRELAALVDELVELATEQRGDEAEDDVELGALVERVAERARRRSGRTVLVDADGSALVGRPGALERAVSNLVDNAAKFGGGDRAPIEVTVRRGRVTVCDRGPGIDPADLPHVFDRFYRAVPARSRPGSGLGLAIVRDVAEAHGGHVFAEAREGGGACVGFEVPVR
ncbi:MAG: HAMP domain-containing histidine kinase [Acidimicrobiales bacterium]|nr:HAMP domain-containing histidine kinase [Acidimicrobiales bacterium]